MLMLGQTGYDAALRWLPSPEPDVAGYAILMRSTTAPVREREIYVGDVDRYVLPDVSIDDVVIGVRAIDKHGNQSIVAAYLEPTPRPQAPGTGKPPVASEPVRSSASSQTGTAADRTQR